MDPKTMISLLLLLLLGLCNAHYDNDHGADNGVFMDTSDTEDISTIILRMNNGSRNGLLEGDMVIPNTRNAMKCPNGGNSCLWQKSANGRVEIPYIISDRYDSTEKNTILQAMNNFKDTTCISFIPRATQTMYLSIEPKAGCSSLVGSTGDKQVVSLQRYGCVQHGIIQHELLHALGFYHEHTRSDRDKYIQINWNNIEEGFSNNFQIKDTNNLNTLYDYSSIMQYGRTAFGNNGAVTIIPIPDSSVPIGRRVGMSNIDILRVNRLYQC